MELETKNHDISPQGQADSGPYLVLAHNPCFTFIHRQINSVLFFWLLTLILIILCGFPNFSYRHISYRKKSNSAFDTHILKFSTTKKLKHNWKKFAGGAFWRYFPWIGIHVVIFFQSPKIPLFGSHVTQGNWIYWKKWLTKPSIFFCYKEGHCTKKVKKFWLRMF